MAPWVFLLIVFAAGAIGGVVNGLLTDNGFFLPAPVVINGATFYRPGIIGNLVVSGVAATLSWALYGPMAAVFIAGGPSTQAPVGDFGITISGIAGAMLVGIGGARWLTNEVDKSLLRVAATVAASRQPSMSIAAQMASATPSATVRLAEALCKVDQPRNIVTSRSDSIASLSTGTPTMPDEEAAIHDGFKDQLQKMFQLMYQSSLSDGLDASAERFSVGLGALRAAKQHAIQIVSAGSSQPATAAARETKPSTALGH